MAAPHHDEGFLRGSDGGNLYHQRWFPDHYSRAVIVLVHGLGEHSGRYQHVAEALTGAGYAVHAVDHRGHGKSDGKRAYVKQFRELVDDLDIFRRHVAQEHPELPMVLVGHSMGGTIALAYALDHPDDVDALVLSGPALKAGDDFSETQLKIFKLLAKVAPGIRPQGLSAEAISRDPAVVAAYIADPLVFNGKVSAGLGAGIFNQMDEFPPRYAELRLPTLLLHGTADKLTNIEGTRELEAGAVNAEVTAHHYDGLYHEVFNEPEQQQVIGDLLSWLDSTLP